jgi:OOP family OmpA-OmpF porin
MVSETTSPKSIISKDTLNKSLKAKQALIPQDLTIHFAFDKYELIPNENLEKYFILSKDYLAKNSLAKLSITGHTDAIGTNEYNRALGFRRAYSLKYYFEKKGMLANRIFIDSKGEQNPSDGNNTSEGRANNRRTEITIKK